MKNRTREICTSGSVRDEDGNILIYSANDRGIEETSASFEAATRLDPTRLPFSDIAGSVADLPKLHIARTWLAYAFRKLPPQ